MSIRAILEKYGFFLAKTFPQDKWGQASENWYLADGELSAHYVPKVGLVTLWREEGLNIDGYYIVRQIGQEIKPEKLDALLERCVRRLVDDKKAKRQLI